MPQVFSYRFTLCILLAAALFFLCPQALEGQKAEKSCCGGSCSCCSGCSAYSKKSHTQMNKNLDKNIRQA